MKRAIIFANSDFVLQDLSRSEVELAAAEVHKILSAKIYGAYKTKPYSDLPAQDIRSKLREFASNVSSKDDALIYLVGHGAVDDAGNFCFFGTDFDHSDLRGQQRPRTVVTEAYLIDYIKSIRVRHLVIIADCCHGSKLAKAVSRLETGDLECETIEILTSGNSNAENFTNGVDCVLSERITKLIQSGRAAGRNRALTVKKLFEYLASRAFDEENIRPKYTFIGPEDVHSAVLSANPNHSNQISPSIIERLYSRSPDQSKRGLIEIEELANLSGNRIRRRIIEHLEEYSKHVKLQTPSLFDDARLSVARIRNVQAAFTETSPESIVMYTPQVYFRVQDQIERHLSSKSTTFFAVLDESITHREIEVDLTQEIQGGTPCRVILSDDISPRVQLWLVDLFRSIEQTTNGLVPNLVVEYLGSSISAFQETSHGIILNQYLEKEPSTKMAFLQSGKPKIYPCESFFRYLLQQQESRLDEVSKNESIEEKISFGRDSVLVPKFLALKRAGRPVLAVIDSSARVDLSKLQRTSEALISCKFLTNDELKTIGFEPQKVHPMFLDPQEVFSNIFIDARIFFQFTMFPHSLVSLPDYRDENMGSEAFTISISSFIRALQMTQPAKKIVYSDIVTKQPYSSVQASLIGSHPSFSRFAPTPSGSLHMGNLRTAVLSALFSMPNNATGDFHVRFDDTNVDPDRANEVRDRILRDLAWIGLPVKKHFNQSDEERQPLYNSALKMLREANFLDELPDGNISLKHSNVKNRYSYFYDLLRGPIVRHGIPQVDGKGDPLDYSLYWPERNMYKYKFSGIIDDLLSSSVVVRDSRQMDSFFTARQSILAQALREARDYCSVTGKGDVVDEFWNQVSRFRPHRLAASPLFCTPLYLHVPRVRNSKGEIVSKSKGNADLEIERIRHGGKLFPETVVAWILASFGKSFLESIGYRSILELIGDIAPLGSENFLSHISGKIDFWSLVQSQGMKDISVGGLSRIDRLVLQASSPYSLKKHLSHIETGRAVSDRQIAAFVDAIHPLRLEFSGAAEVSAFFSECASKGWLSLGEAHSSLFSSDALESVECPLRRSELYPALRQKLFGDRSGPSVVALQTVVKSINGLL